MHPTYEVTLPRNPGPPLAITAAQALALHTQMQTAFTLISTRTGEQTNTKLARDADVDALFDEVSMTINELRDLLSDTDPRWENFGLNIPATRTRPRA